MCNSRTLVPWPRRLAAVKMGTTLAPALPVCGVCAVSEGRKRIMSGLTLRRIVSFSVLALALGSASCGGDGVGRDSALVGGSCEVVGDCEEECLTGQDYPEGTCSVSCSLDDDCPSGAHCIDEDGGVCLMACELPSDCRGGYTCKGKDNKGHGGESLVCFKD